MFFEVCGYKFTKCNKKTTCSVMFEFLAKNGFDTKIDHCDEGGTVNNIEAIT